MPEVIYATHNRGKLAEAQAIAAKFGLTVVGAGELGLGSVDETGDTYRENALLKARVAATRGGFVFAEDSGLEVEGLDWGPGAYSARFGGDISQPERNEMLLRLLAGKSRRARFVAVCAIIMPDGRESFTEGVLRGEIAERPSGSGGFGYDPIFIPEGFTATIAELSIADKNRISHRGQALRRAFDIIVGEIDS